MFIMLLCPIGFLFSRSAQNAGRYKHAIYLLIILGFVLRMFTASDMFLHEWDERYHALVAKHMMSHVFTPTLYETQVLPADYKNWTLTHIWLHKQPLPLWTMALSMKIFGINEVALRLPSVLFSTTCIWLTYRIGRYFSDAKTAYIAAFLFSINGLVIEMAAGRTATDHIDTSFLFFITLSIFFTILFAEKRRIIYNILTGVSIGAAILCKWLPALIVLPVWVLILLDTRHFSIKAIAVQFMLLLLTIVVVFIPWQLYIFHTFPAEAAWEYKLNTKHLAHIVEGQSGPFYFYLQKIQINYNDLIYLPILYFLWQTAKHRGNLKNLALLVWFSVPIIFFSFAATKMQGYILFTSPALFIVIAVFYRDMRSLKTSKKWRYAINVLLFLLVALPIHYSIERIKPFQNRTGKSQWANELRMLNKENIQNGVLLNYPRPVEAMFYTNVMAYERLPAANEIITLRDKGYIVLINDTGNLSPDIKHIQGIRILKLSTR